MAGQRGQTAHRRGKRNESWLRGEARKDANRKANDARHLKNAARGGTVRELGRLERFGPARTVTD